MRKKSVLSVILGIVVVVALVHTAAQVVLFGTGIPGFAQQGISGFSIQPQGDTTDAQPALGSSLSFVFVIVEWLFVGFLFFFVSMRNRTFLKVEADDLKTTLKASGVAHTDIDRLYDLLKQKKRLSIPAIARAFNVKEAVVLEWGETLELGKLAIINYPRIGHPELVLVEQVEKTEKVEENLNEKENMNENTEKENNVDKKMEKKHEKGKK